MRPWDATSRKTAAISPFGQHIDGDKKAFGIFFKPNDLVSKPTTPTGFTKRFSPLLERESSICHGHNTVILALWGEERAARRGSGLANNLA
jgi:hypothetical protein